MAKNMTEGSPAGLLLKFALPLLVGNLLQQTYNIIDTAIVGKVLGAGALASVGSTSSVQFMVLGFCIGICCGFGIPIAKCFGARDHEGMRNYIYHAGLWTAIISVILTALCVLLCPTILHILSIKPDIYDGAYQYLVVIFAGLPFTLLYNLMSGILRSVGDSKTPFYFLAFSTVLNIFLDLFCIIVLGWGCAGAAAATIASQAVSGILCLLYIHKKVELLHLKKENCHFSGHYTAILLGMGLPMGLQYSITAIGSMVMQSANNGLGGSYVSGFTAGLKIKQFLMCPFDAFATSTSVYCGQNIGAGRLDRVRDGVRKGVMIATGYGFLAGLVLIFFGRGLSHMFLSAQEVEALDAAAKYMRYMGFFFWSLGILNVVRQSVQGMGYSGRAVFAGVVEMFARSLICIGLVGSLGYTAICMADETAWLSACCYLVPIYFWCLKISRSRMKAGKQL